MPGMGSGLSANNAAVVAAFHAALLHQGLIVILIMALVATAWNVLRTAQLRQASSSSVRPAPFARPWPAVEPAARRLLRVAFGLIWLLDGILQAQAQMPLGLVPQAIQPTAAASPHWAQQVVNVGTTVWTYHPVSAAAASVWAQLGIGVWLLVAPRGYWSRWAGAVSAGWGLVVWVFGESFGGIFAPGSSWMFGTPGAVLFYCLAGALIALPESSWGTPRLGRNVLRGMGTLLVGMAVLQAWPGRGFWQGSGRPGGAPGTLTAMVQQMAQTPQPAFVSSSVSAFGRFDSAHGFAVNLFVVVALAALGALFLSGRPRLARWGVMASTLICLADWALVQDFGFFGGVGTDPNSMVPMALIIVAGYVALTKVPGRDENVVAINVPPSTRSIWTKAVANPAHAFRCVAALGAIGVLLLGAVPLAVDSGEPHADAILAEAIDGSPQTVADRAPGFTLVDQDDKVVSLASLQGKAVALTFLDDTCTTDCPVIAHEFLTADKYLGRDAHRVEMVAIDANPRFINPMYLAAFDRQEGLEHFSNWLYLTGSLAQLRRVWQEYGEEVSYLPGGAMVQHGEYAYVIGPGGEDRYVLDTDPGPATSASGSSFAGMLAATIKTVLVKPS